MLAESKVSNMEGISDGNMMAKAQQIWTMLDEMSENNPQAYRKFIDKQAQERKMFMEPPVAHMCVKTLMYEPKKVNFYINIFGWLRVHGPKDDEAPIPVMGGQLMDGQETDGAYKAVAIAFAPKVVEEFGRDAKIPEERRLLIKLAIDFVQDSQKVKLSRNYEVLGKDVMCKGSEEKSINSLKAIFKKYDEKTEEELKKFTNTFAPMQTVGSDEMLGNITNDSKINGKGPILTKLQEDSRVDPKIKIVPDTKQKKGLIQEISDDPLTLAKPEYSIQVKDLDDSKPRRVVVRVELPGVTSVKECDLDISEDDLTLLVTEKYEICLPFQEKVKEDEASAKFSTKSSSLTVTVPTVRTS